MKVFTFLAVVALVAATVVLAQCPYASNPAAADGKAVPAGHPPVVATTFSQSRGRSLNAAPGQDYASLVSKVDFEALKKDLQLMFTYSRSFWPADFGHYGPFLVRQAWHAAGSYRTYDGRGGADGGRQRFEPELSWADNTNLDKAKRLLWPLKQKYGASLSWGDLIVFAGTYAIEAMKGPKMGFCAGRVDDDNGDESLELGPTEYQEKHIPCLDQGNCLPPFGTTTIGLIYVNPEGPKGNASQVALLAQQIRDTFARMGMNDAETVALIGGGHAVGKAHGACATGPGPSPAEDPSNPWPGTCGGPVVTSGFEGQWTPTPTTFSNGYFTMLLNNTWVPHTGPGGHTQWRIQGAPANSTLMMLTSDVSLLSDPSYLQLAKQFQADDALFQSTFAGAWYKLMTRDMGPASRCVGPLALPPQPFQHPLPPAPKPLANFDAVRADVRAALRSASAASLLAPDFEGANKPYYGGALVNLAFQCAATFRATDYQGGCNGARIALEPQLSWPVNRGVNGTLALLAPIKTKYGASLSWADLIVLAGNVALEDAAAAGKPSTAWTLPFCGGRSDAAANDTASRVLQPPPSFNISAAGIRQKLRDSGLSAREYVALAGRLRSPAQMARVGYAPFSYVHQNTTEVSTLDNAFFVALLQYNWQPVPNTDPVQYKAVSHNKYLTLSDMQLLWEPDFRAIVQEYAADNALFLADFAAAWTKLMTADRFDGPTRNLCVEAAEDSGSGVSGNPYLSATVAVGVTLALVGLIYLFCRCSADKKKATKDGALLDDHN